MPGILVVEDEISVSMELEEMLVENGYQVQGVVDSGEKAIDMAGRLEPDFILMDIGLSGRLDGIEAAAKIRSRFNIPSVFLTGHGEKELVDRAVKTQPLGYIMKPLNEHQILAAVAVAMGNRNQEKVDQHEAPYKHIPKDFLSFSAKELKIAELIRDGNETATISEIQGISIDTVNWHRKNIRKKLGIANARIDLVVFLRSLNDS